jgi:hypothetical protein
LNAGKLKSINIVCLWLKNAALQASAAQIGINYALLHEINLSKICRIKKQTLPLQPQTRG